ncbi:hypothetical protein GYH30_032112 [Glycine max]|uniref:Uncharacterized protein n=1 Tax=Glycine max TaxID=3847 RepID=A0A0R0HS81_SOYBN|nr:hypothetical protein GYH30_032112 [Glycine max]
MTQMKKKTCKKRKQTEYLKVNPKIKTLRGSMVFIPPNGGIFQNKKERNFANFLIQVKNLYSREVIVIHQSEITPMKRNNRPSKIIFHGQTPRNRGL